MGLLLQGGSSAKAALQTSHLLVLFTPSADVADGLLQHPATRDLFAQRLGPTALALREGSTEKLEAALRGLGLELGEA
jgi:hypothetical protein